jgi:lysophospholipase L1-like esterase
MGASLRHAVLFLTLALPAVAARADFELRDGDTVVFLGDSITAARGYTKIVEHYALMRYPDRRARFINAGQGGDTASASLKRLERDVFDKGATVVTVAFGINDIGWGLKADPHHRQLYLDGVRSIVEACKARGVRPFICSPAITAEDPDRLGDGVLSGLHQHRGAVHRGVDGGLDGPEVAAAGLIDDQRRRAQDAR